MTTIFNLPMDLAEEIISRVPLKYMKAVRLTCKKWETLSKTRSFTKTHLAKTTAKELGESQTIMLMDYNLYLKSIVFNGIDVDPSIEPEGKLTCLNEQFKISQVFHCEGLLLCILKDTLKFVVWNPYWGHTRLIEPRYFHQKLHGYSDRYRYALGYVNTKNKSCRSHKILRFLDDHVHPTGSFAVSKEFFWYEIYDFDSSLWTTLDVTPDWKIQFYQRGVSLKGNTYFCATKIKSRNELDNHIICFDFTKERFGLLMRFPFSVGYHDIVTLSCVREEKLAVLLQHYEAGSCEIEIWITTKIEAEIVLWSKFLKIDMGPDLDVNRISSGSFFIDEEKKVVMGFYRNNPSSIRNHVNFIGEDKYFKGLDLGERAEKGCKASVCSYVPSLVQIKQNAGCKRKKQSSFETRRFNKKMSTLVAIEKPIDERYGLRPRKEKVKRD